MSYQLGDRVAISKLKKEGVIAEVIRPGMYKVQVGALLVQCQDADLTAPKPRKPIKKKVKSQVSFDEGPVRTVDLHGKTVAEALSMVELACNQSLLESAAEIKIMHGMGTGKLKNALHKYLSKASYVAHFKIDDTNPGVTRVFF